METNKFTSDRIRSKMPKPYRSAVSLVSIQSIVLFDLSIKIGTLNIQRYLKLYDLLMTINIALIGIGETILNSSPVNIIW